MQRCTHSDASLARLLSVSGIVPVSPAEKAFLRGHSKRASERRATASMTHDDDPTNAQELQFSQAAERVRQRAQRVALHEAAQCWRQSRVKKQQSFDWRACGRAQLLERANVAQLVRQRTHEVVLKHVAAETPAKPRHHSSRVRIPAGHTRTWMSRRRPSSRCRRRCTCWSPCPPQRRPSPSLMSRRSRLRRRRARRGRCTPWRCPQRRR